MINCAYIGFGKSATRYHLPYVLCRKDKYNVKRIYDIARKPEVEAQPHYQHICFTSRLQDILEEGGELTNRVAYEELVNTEFAKKALER